MAKSKYTPEVVQEILEAIARDGRDSSGWLAGGISKDTFYLWQHKYKGFSDSIARAKSEFKKHCPEEIKKLARNKLIEALENGQPIKRQSTVTRKVDMLDTDGKLMWTQETTETKEHVDIMPSPKWAIQMVLPKPTNELEAIETLVNAGWLPREVLEVASDGVSELREKIKEAFRRIPANNEQRGESPPPSTTGETRTIL